MVTPLSITIYGSVTCEDTAITTARLRALNIPFTLYNREENSNVDALLEKYNNGKRVTPTLVFGDAQFVIAEPSLQDLEAALREVGYEFEAARADEIRGALKNQRLPNFTLPSSRGDAVTLYKLPRRKRAVLFFVDDANDRVSQGYARQLTNQRELFEEYNALPLPIVRADLQTTKEWAHEFARGYAALSDADGNVKQEYAALLGVNATEALLVILDSFCAPRAVSHAADAGGLIAPNEITSWLRLLDCECDE